MYLLLIRYRIVSSLSYITFLTFLYYHSLLHVILDGHLGCCYLGCFQGCLQGYDLGFLPDYFPDFHYLFDSFCLAVGDFLFAVYLPAVDCLSEAFLPAVDSLSEVFLPAVDCFSEVYLPAVDYLSEVSVRGFDDHCVDSLYYHHVPQVQTLYLKYRHFAAVAYFAAEHFRH